MMDDSPGRHTRAHDDDALPPELAAAYRADPERDAIDLDAGWKSLRPLLARPDATRARPAVRRLRSRRIVFTGVAAGAALAASMALMLRTSPETSTDSRPAPPVVVTSATAASAPYLRAVADLEMVLRDGRTRLQPRTIAALEQSLAAIDRAIREAEAALAADPANDYVADWLEAVRARKLRVLRDALADINAVSRV